MTITEILIIGLASCVILCLLINKIIRKSEDKKLAQGLVKFVSKYEGVELGKPKQVKMWNNEELEKEQIEKGLVKFESKSEYVKVGKSPNVKEEKFEDEQMEKGLVKFESKYEGVKWGKPPQVEAWKFIEEQIEVSPFAKGYVKFVKYSGEEKWLVKFINRFGIEILGTSKQKFIEEQVSKGYVKFINTDGEENWRKPQPDFFLEGLYGRKGWEKFVDANGEEKWGTPQQKYYIEQVLNGSNELLNKLGEKWEIAKQFEVWKTEEFEDRQMANVYVKFVNKYREEKWGRPQQVEIWKTEELFETEQSAKGFVKFINKYREEKWGTPQQVKIWAKKDIFEAEQTAKGYFKFVNTEGEEIWGTPYQVELLKKKEKEDELKEKQRLRVTSGFVGNREKDAVAESYKMK